MKDSNFAIVSWPLALVLIALLMTAFNLVFSFIERVSPFSILTRDILGAEPTEAKGEGLLESPGGVAGRPASDSPRCRENLTPLGLEISISFIRACSSSSRCRAASSRSTSIRTKLATCSCICWRWQSSQASKSFKRPTQSSEHPNRGVGRPRVPFRKARSRSPIDMPISRSSPPSPFLPSKIPSQRRSAFPVYAHRFKYMQNSSRDTVPVLLGSNAVNAALKERNLEEIREAKV
mmetsp:Transcript_68858/g.158046  ORF Transcript_68858/g.158046 Transcript_68858/m.158046 type:complete len:235 (-) Transcript_68858:418-1122(-)